MNNCLDPLTVQLLLENINNLKYNILDKNYGRSNEISIISKDIYMVQFEHQIRENSRNIEDSNILTILEPMFANISLDRLLRIKVNITLPTTSYDKEKLIHTEELESGCKSCILFLTTSNGGGTKFDDGRFFESISGNYHVFNSKDKHYGIPSNDDKLRCAINIIYKEQE